MRISRKWLSQYMDISDLSIEEIAQKITDAGLEVEAVEHQSQGTNLVIGEVLECTDHPDSDHLHCTKVNVGNEVLNIVCGAPNVAAGQKVIVALPGAKLPGGEIKKGVIRGQESNGMICSLLELGVNPHLLTEEQKAGIEILDAQAPVGNTDPLQYLGWDDEILEIGLTPNRNDCLASFNMAVEAGAILHREVKLPAYQKASECGGSTKLQVSSKTKKCPLFLGKVIGNITIKESPLWMKELLRASGMHSINNVVDISNIVMLETGQPMHFYDKDAIKNQEITVVDGIQEDYTALDGVTYALQPEDIVITNDGKPIGIAGIMGGDDSKILDTTTGLIIECAIFDHVSIRNTARRLNLATESSIRYQKGIEPLAAQKAVDRAVQLLIEYADAKEIEETVQYGQTPYQPKTLSCQYMAINDRLGTDFTKEEILEVFKRLQWNPIDHQDHFTVDIPSYRTDVEGMADLSEEVIRLIGYDRLPSTLPMMEMTEGKLNPSQRLRRELRQYFTTQGLQDCVTYTLISTKKMENAILSAGEAIELASPMSEERRYIRTSILPSLIDVVSYNQARHIPNINVFELSDVAAKEGVQTHGAFVLSEELQQTKWTGYSLPADFYTAKGLMEAILEKMGINEKRIHFVANEVDTQHFHPYRSACIRIDQETIGIVGQIHPQYAKETDCKDVILCEFDYGKILTSKKAKIKYVPISKYPSVQRDLAFVMDRSMPVSQVVDVINKHGKLDKEMIVKSVEVFDVYQGEHVADNEKSIALRILFQSDKKTLNEEEINTLFNGIIDAIQKECNATLRN